MNEHEEKAEQVAPSGLPINTVSIAERSAKSLTQTLYYTLSLLQCVVSIALGWFVTTVTQYSHDSAYVDPATGETWYTAVTVPNIWLGIAVGIVSLVLGVLLCKLFCALLYIVVHYFEVKTKKEEAL